MREIRFGHSGLRVKYRLVSFRSEFLGLRHLDLNRYLKKFGSDLDLFLMDPGHFESIFQVPVKYMFFG